MRYFVITLILISLFGCKSADKQHQSSPYVRVVDGKFMVGDSVYRYVGANLWYGAILASTGRGGDRERLESELDALQRIGVKNLRVLVGGDGAENVPSHIMPVLQTAPGVYNDTILAGLDYLMYSLERRGMKAVLYLNNAWEWSGGYGTYLDWAGDSVTPNPATDGYDRYMRHVARFVTNDSAKAMAAAHVAAIVSRANRYTGCPYSRSPALMSWQIANEPRAFSSDSTVKRAFAEWISSQAALIKSLDANHLVSTGSEGRHGCESDMDLWRDIHDDPNIDYAVLHMWPYNWGWAGADSLIEDVDSACAKATDYIMAHRAVADSIGKPLVLEEFGYPRDGFVFALGTPVTARDRFYDHIFTLISERGVLDGCNFWGWGGSARPAHENWQPWDDYTGDPAQEAQGLNSVFSTDSTTLEIIERHVARLDNR